MGLALEGQVIQKVSYHFLRVHWSLLSLVLLVGYSTVGLVDRYQVYLVACRRRSAKYFTRVAGMMHKSKPLAAFTKLLDEYSSPGI